MLLEFRPEGILPDVMDETLEAVASVDKQSAANIPKVGVVVGAVEDVRNTTALGGATEKTAHECESMKINVEPKTRGRKRKKQPRLRNGDNILEV